MRVLAIDDHPLLQQIIPELLRKALGKVELAMAPSLEEGLRLARAEPPELTLLDLGLPGCAGLEALSRFRMTFPCLRVAVVSAESEQHVIEGALHAGAVGFIPKTLKPDIVVEALRRIAAGGTYAPSPEALGDLSRP